MSSRGSAIAIVVLGNTGNRLAECALPLHKGWVRRNASVGTLVDTGKAIHVQLKEQKGKELVSQQKGNNNLKVHNQQNYIRTCRRKDSN